MVTSGSFKLGPSDGQLLVRIYREGMAKKVGHDLVMELTSWSANVTVDGDSSSIDATADPRSFEVREASGGVKPLSDGDRADIKKNIENKVLNTGKHPEILFRSTSVRSTGPDRGTISGELTIAGTTRPVDFDVVVNGDRARMTATVVQSQWGIKPFSAMMGALKVKDAVEMEADVRLPA